MRTNIEDAFDRFLEQEWMNALHVAAVEPSGWVAGKIGVEKPAFRPPKKVGNTVPK
jgi:hypothetical protein